jgi:23S rRNA pseudouridine2605 synthase
VTIDGDVAALGARADPESALIEIDGVPLPVDPGLVYYLVAKPVDVISTSEDTHGRPTVVDLVPDTPRVYPVGRLDADSEGLIIVTNDGDLTLRLTHPRHQIPKTYVALADGDVTDQEVRRLTTGIELNDGVARARSARIIDRSRNRTLVEVVMTEGRKREVRRMFDGLGHRVERLIRTAIGPLRDHRLRPGEWRKLEVREVRALYERASLPWQDDAGDDGRSM